VFSVRYQINIDTIFKRISGRRDSVVGITTTLRTGQSGVRILARVINFSLLQYIQADSGVHPASCSVGNGVRSLG
jgi:hypothetical protein